MHAMELSVDGVENSRLSTAASIALRDGNAIPQLGLGVFQTPPDITASVVRTALAAGYRHIDTAAVYVNELGVGEGLRAAEIERSEVFVTTKLWNADQGFDAAIKGFDHSVKRLGVDYLDLYLIHWPSPRRDLYVDTWRALVRLQQDGRVRSIGVSNFGAPHLQRLIDETYTQLGRADILVNNAGIEIEAAFWDVTEADYDAVLNVNLKGAFFLTQAFVRRLRDAKQPGRIINISSVHEDIAFPHFSTYCASKGGIRMLMRNLAVELGPLGITVNNIAPGAIATPINKALLEDKPKLDALLANIPLSRLGTSEEVAGLAAFLASDEAAYVTGSTYVIDGGLMVDYHEQ